MSIELALRQHIADLEAQVPKIVKPRRVIHADWRDDWMECDCKEPVTVDNKYCPHCGEKLDWRGA